MLTPRAVPPSTGVKEVMSPISEGPGAGNHAQSPSHEIPGEWQAMPCEMVSSTPVVAHQQYDGMSRESLHFDTAEGPQDNSISLELDQHHSTALSPFQPVCKNELCQLQQSVFDTSSLPESGTIDRGPLPSWSACSSSKEIIGSSQGSRTSNTAGDSSTAFARTLNVQWQAVPEDSQLQSASMVHQLWIDRHLGDFESAEDWAIQHGSISTDTTAMATEVTGAMASLHVSEVSCSLAQVYQAAKRTKRSVW
jgi:hypothetical protein